MNQQQKLAHERMMASLQVRTHLKMTPKDEPWNRGLKYKLNEEKGKKGREAAGLVIPEFRTLKQKHD